MTLRLPPLKALHTFEVAARHESFSAAAGELHVTHGAVSHQVKALERWLGVSLFDRVTRAVRLNDAGRVYLPAIQNAFRQIAESTAVVTGSKADAPLHVTATSAFAVRWLAPRLGRLWEAHPDLDLRLHEMPWTTDTTFTGTRVELVVRIGPPRGAGVESVALMPGSVVPTCSPRLVDGPGGAPRPRRPEDLLAFKLLHGYDHGPWRDWFERAGVAGADVTHGPVFDDTNLIYSAVLSGQGVGLLHTALTRDETEAGQLVRLFDEPPREEFGYYVAYPAASRTDRRIAGFREWLLATAQG